MTLTCDLLLLTGSALCTAAVSALDQVFHQTFEGGHQQPHSEKDIVKNKQQGRLMLEYILWDPLKFVLS